MACSRVFTLIPTLGIMVSLQEIDMDDVKLRELLEILADLSLNGETFEIAHAALRLQTELVNAYGNNLL